MKLIRERLAESVGAFQGAFSNPALRRLQIAGAASVMGQWAYSVALAVYAFQQGGAKAVGLVALIRMIPAAISAPFTSTLADRLPRVAVMASTSLARVATIGSAGVVIEVGGPPGLVYALAGMTTILGDGVPPGRVGRTSRAGADARGADRRERRPQHDRQRRQLRRTGARRVAAGGH